MLFWSNSSSYCFCNRQPTKRALSGGLLSFVCWALGACITAFGPSPLLHSSAARVFCIGIYTKKRTWRFQKNHFVWKFTRKMPITDSGTRILWKFTGRNAHGHCTKAYKRHFVWKCTGKMPDPPANTSIEHRVLTVTVRTPQCGHTACGNV